MFFPPVLVFASIFVTCCLATSTLGATLPKDEVEALKSIGETIGKRNWNFGVDPCSIGDKSWFENTTSDSDYYVNQLKCDCSFNDNTTCHVVGIVLKAQSLPGTLPPQLVNLPFLQEIDLTRNYLNGTIPRIWGSMLHLNKISVLGNRLTGPIPGDLANLSNLTVLVLEHNNLSGELPAALGNLPKLEQLFLNSNNFTGELPVTFARLTTLKKVRIGDNNFRGKIPDFIFQNWTNLDEIRIDASGLSGPIPDIVSSGNLETIMINDLNGVEATNFPQLRNLSNLEYLILRSCNLVGKLPTSLESLTKLKTLDLSFNRLGGEVRVSLPDVRQLFLTGNMFTGAVPPWIIDTRRQIDISYNNFTSTGVDDCQRSNLNLFASTSRINNSGPVSCLGSLNCPVEPLHFLYINCGGRGIDVNNNTYEADSNNGLPFPKYYPSRTWVSSSTGIFWDAAVRAKDNTVLENTELSSSVGQLYINARISPSSLTYYAFCLRNATYNVSLHFAEIQFTDGQNYSSLGRRIFDVYIQGKRQLKDFNIKDEAGGVGKPIVKSFTANVSDGTLEIRLHWAGKGTTSIPVRGVYGPLISAISVIDPAVSKPQPVKGGRISVAGEVGIVTAATFSTFMIICGILWWGGCLRRKSTLERDLQGVKLQTSSFTLRQIKAATNNFDAANKIGEGGFGPVYKGILADGTEIAVKQLSARSRQGNREFVTEIGLISSLKHPHLVKLYGCCIEGNQLLLIYEYLENNSLARALFGPEEFQLTLDWPTRRKICIGIAKGLAYLHEESRLKIVHRDIKATNVLLDKNLNPKISDFGLAKLDEEDNTHISTRIAGTYGYMAPEYAMHGRLTAKADVYSFGIVTLEIVSGMCIAKNSRLKEESFYLLTLAHTLKEEGKLLDLIDPSIASNCNTEEAMSMINVALLCTNHTSAARPSMSRVVSLLEGKMSVSDILKDSSIRGIEFNEEENNDVENNSQTKSMLGDGQTTSYSDLYPVSMTSSYWQNRDSSSTN